MTTGFWICTDCGFSMEVEVDAIVSRCPKCKVKYKRVKIIQPHIEHRIAVMKSSTGKLNVVRPIIFAINEENKKDFMEYLRILDKLINKGQPTYIS